MEVVEKMAMLQRFLGLVLLFFCVSWASAQVPGSQNLSSGTVAFLHAAVIPMDKERVLRDQTVVITNGKIVAIGSSSSVKVPRKALRVDATGRYLLPALCDMHVHLLGEAWNIMVPPKAQSKGKNVPFGDFLLPYVANGVTTVQSMSATPPEIILRERINKGELLGPRLILAPMIDGPKKAWPPPLSTWVDSAAEARDAVRRFKSDGYDKVKVYSFLSKDSYDAIISTAREQRMDVIGHIPMSVSLEYVLDAGQKLIAHSEEVEKHSGGKHDAEHIHYFATRMADRGVWMTPTLVTTRSLLNFFDDPDSPLARPEAAYFRHPMQRGVWSFMATNLYGPIPSEGRSRIRKGFEAFQRPLTKAFHDRGGKMMTGTDSLMLGIFPGSAVHDELREMVEAGLTPYQALRTSTINPFEYLGEANRAGTVELGKQSDLILVDGDPLEDISATSRISGVLIRGRWIERKEILKMMQEVAAAF
jgi:hypothetical protein